MATKEKTTSRINELISIPQKTVHETLRPHPEDRERMTFFFKHVLIENFGVYTLLGSKPITEFRYAPYIDECEKSPLHGAVSALQKIDLLCKVPADRRRCQKTLGGLEKG